MPFGQANNKQSAWQGLTHRIQCPSARAFFCFRKLGVGADPASFQATANINYSENARLCFLSHFGDPKRSPQHFFGEGTLVGGRSGEQKGSHKFGGRPLLTHPFLDIPTSSVFGVCCGFFKKEGNKHGRTTSLDIHTQKYKEQKRRAHQTSSGRGGLLPAPHGALRAERCGQQCAAPGPLRSARLEVTGGFLFKGNPSGSTYPCGVVFFSGRPTRFP